LAAFTDHQPHRIHLRFWQIGDNESGIVTLGQNLGLADHSSCSAPALERGVLKLHKAAARGLQCSLLDPTLKRGKLALHAGHFCDVCAAQILSERELGNNWAARSPNSMISRSLNDRCANCSIYDFDVLQRGDATHRLKSKHMDALIDPIDSTPLPTPEEDQDNKPANAVKVFSYACKIAYPEEAAHVEHQLTLTHRHRNLLTETLLKGREKYREIIKEYLGLDIKVLEEQAEEITTEIKAVQQEISDWKKQNRTTKTQPDLSDRLRHLRTERKPIFEKIRAVKKAAKEDPSIKPSIEQANTAVDAAIKEARNHYSRQLGLYWPNYLESERAANQARFQRMDPKFHRWTGEGSLAIQFQKGLSVAELFECQDSRLRLIPPNIANTNALRANGQIRGKERHVRVLYRVQSNEDRSPRWITLEVTMHRMLPANGIIKWAHLQRQKSSGAIGKTYLSLTKDYDYTLRLTLEEPPQEERNKAKVAIEVGWRLFETGLRVAVALGEDGNLRELYLPKQWLDGKRKAESLGSIIDRGTNQTALAIKAAHPELYKKAEQPESPKKPTTAATPATLAWAGDNPRRLAAALLKIYREDPTLRPELEKWRKHHFHLLRYKKGLNDKLIRIRREIYRKFVSDLAKKYSICGIEDFDLRQVTTKDQAHELVKWQRTAAGISSLRLMLSQRLTAQKLSAENTTQKCHNCGSLEKWDAAHAVWHRCKQCNSRWDQDHNSVRNLLDLLCETPGEEKMTDTA
jgi:Putative transposase DNA-binding domain